MKKLTLSSYKCKMEIDEINGKYTLYFTCDMDGEIHNTISYEFNNNDLGIEFESSVNSIYSDSSDLELEFGLIDEERLMTFFSIIDYSLDTSYYLGKKKYRFEVSQNKPYYNEFKKIVEAIRLDKRYKGGKKDEHKSYSVKH